MANKTNKSIKKCEYRYCQKPLPKNVHGNRRYCPGTDCEKLEAFERLLDKKSQIYKLLVESVEKRIYKNDSRFLKDLKREAKYLFLYYGKLHFEFLWSAMRQIGYELTNSKRRILKGWLFEHEQKFYKQYIKD